MGKQIKSGFIGFAIGILFLLIGLSMTHGENVEEPTERQDAAEGIVVNHEIKQVDEKENLSNEMEWKQNGKTEYDDIYVLNNVAVPEKFVEELLIYSYIEYGIRKYNEENGLQDRYDVDIYEDVLPFDTIPKTDEVSNYLYKTDLAKPMIPELSNNIYFLKLESADNILYMSIDTYNMKIYIYNDEMTIAH